MPLHIGVHVADQHDQLAIADPGKHLIAIVPTFLKSLDVDSVMNHSHFFRRKSILRDQRVTDWSGIGQHCATQILNASQPLSALALVPVEVREVAPAGNNRRHAR